MYPNFPLQCKYCIDDMSKPYYSCSKAERCTLRIINSKTYCPILEKEMKTCGSQYVTNSLTLTPSMASP